MLETQIDILYTRQNASVALVDPVSDPGGTPHVSPLWTKNFSISRGFSETLVKMICWHPLLEGWHPFQGNPGSAPGI